MNGPRPMHPTGLRQLYPGGAVVPDLVLQRYKRSKLRRSPDPSFWPEFARNGFGRCIHRERCGSSGCLGLNTAYVRKFGWHADALAPLPATPLPESKPPA